MQKSQPFISNLPIISVCNAKDLVTPFQNNLSFSLSKELKKENERMLTMDAIEYIRRMFHKKECSFRKIMRCARY